jgi:hypothetical protein
MSILNALAFTERNVPIFPCHVWREATGWRKQPHITRWSERATTSPRVIEAWWRCWPDAIVGVPLARVGLVVIDADRHGGPDGVSALQAISLPPHPIVTTKSGGEHHFFRQPAQPIHFKQWSGGEVLGIGRFVVGYSAAPFVSRPPILTPALLARLGERGKGNTANHIRPLRSGLTLTVSLSLQPTASVKLRSKYLLRDLEQTPPGNRHNMLHWTACRFGNMIGEAKIKPEIAEQLLLGAAKANGIYSDDPDNCLTTIRDGLRTGRHEWAALRGRMGKDV